MPLDPGEDELHEDYDDGAADEQGNNPANAE